MSWKNYTNATSELIHYIFTLTIGDTMTAALSNFLETPSSPCTASQKSVYRRAPLSYDVRALEHAPPAPTNERCERAPAGSSQELLPLALVVTTDPPALSTHTVIPSIPRRSKCAFSVDESFFWPYLGLSYWSYWIAQHRQHEVQSKWRFIHERVISVNSIRTSRVYKSKTRQSSWSVHHT